MSHNEKRGVWWKEGIASLISGVSYGITNVMTGSPMDVVKTKMQVFDHYKHHNAFQTACIVYQKYGIKGFFKGVTGPLMGSSVFRAVQFGAFEAFYTKVKDDKFFTSKIPYTFGLEYRIIVGGIISGSCRSVIESPFEYTKVRRQTNQSWEKTHLYYGFRATWLKAVGMMTTYFTIIDSMRRNTNVYNSKILLFFVNGFAATFAFIVIWPFEIVKNRVQTNNIKHYSIIKNLSNNIKKDGIMKGLYRGAGPGLSSVFVRNGCSMIVMLKCQKLMTKLGLRD